MQKKDKKAGLIDNTGKEVVSCIYDEMYYFDGELAKVGKNKKYGYIEKNGREIIPCIYDEIDYDSEENYIIARSKKN